MKYPIRYNDWNENTNTTSITQTYAANRQHKLQMRATESGKIVSEKERCSWEITNGSDERKKSRLK